MFEDATIEEYMNDMNRQVRYDEFVAIMRTGVISMSESPSGKFFEDKRKNQDIIWKEKMKRADFDNDNEINDSKPELEDIKLFVQSELFEKECRNVYA